MNIKKTTNSHKHLDWKYNKMHDVISEAVKDLQASKTKLIFDRVCERVKTDEPINLDIEKFRRFPRLKMEYDSRDQSEHWYWNDGTEEGLHIISFYTSEPKINTPEYSMGFTYR